MTPILNRERLRAAREEKALTQEKLAEFSGLSDRQIRTLETKKVDTAASVLYRVCRVLRKPMDDFMTVVPDEEEADVGQADAESKNWNLDSLPPDIAAELQYRQPMRVSETMVFSMLHGQTGFAVCPRCKLTMEYEYAAFCGYCGQRLNWSRYKHATIRRPGNRAGSE